MTDIAMLGIGVKTTGVDEGARSLDGLSNAAKRAQAAADGMSSSAARVASSIAGTTGALERQATAADRAAAAMSKQSAVVTKVGGVMGTASHNVGNLAAQFQDIGVTAAMGMSPLQIALQQGTQISAVMGPMGAAGALKSLGAAFASVLSPVSLIVIALVGLVAAGAQMVNWANLAESALNAVAASMPKIIEYAVVIGPALAAAFAPAIISAVYGIAAAIGGALVSALSALVGLAAAIGIIPLAFVAAVGAIYVFRDEISQALGIDIVEVAKNGVNLVIGSFFAAFEDLKLLWNQFPNIVGVALVGVQQAVQDGANYVINSFSAAYEAIRGVWDNFPNAIGAAVIGAANAAIKGTAELIQKAASLMDGFISGVNSMLPEGMQMGTIGKIDLSAAEIKNTYSDKLVAAATETKAKMDAIMARDNFGGPVADPFSGKLTEAVEARNAAVEAALNHDYLGDIGSSISAGADKATGKLKELASWVGKLDETAEKKKGGASKESAYDNAIASVDERTDSILAQNRAQAALNPTVNDYGHAMTKAKAAADLLNAAERDKKAITPALIADINAHADALANATVEQNKLAEAQKRAQENIEFAKDATKGFLSSLREGLVAGEGFWKSFGNAAMGVLDKIIDKLETQLVDALFQVGSSGGGGVGGILGGLLGLLGGGGSAFPAAPKVGLFASGTDFAPGGPAIVGERGPELVNLPRGAQVIPNHRIGAVSAANQNVHVSSEVVVSVDDAGKLQAFVARTAQRTVKAGIQQYDKHILPDSLQRVAKQPRARGTSR